MRYGENEFQGGKEMRHRTHDARIAMEKIHRIIERHIEKYGDGGFKRSLLVLTNRFKLWKGNDEIQKNKNQEISQMMRA
jgi:hypothetical protein